MDKKMILLIEELKDHEDVYLMINFNGEQQILNLYNPLKFDKGTIENIILSSSKNDEIVTGLAYQQEDNYSYFAILVNNKVIKSIIGTGRNGVIKDLYGMYPIKTFEYNGR